MDSAKYNLRCNRSISEKMMKKDFIYDIRPPQVTSQKYAETRPSSVTPLHVSEKHNQGRQFPQSNVVFHADDFGGSGDVCMFRERRILSFKCNFCNEPIATLSSLSTHVKSHCKKYCKKCYWVLEGNETMEQHNYFNHQIFSNTPMNFHRAMTFNSTLS